MKKLLMIIGLIAVVIGATYGGAAFAVKPTGDKLIMETEEGSASINPGEYYWFNYPEVRHVSLTIGASGVDTSGSTVEVVVQLSCEGVRVAEGFVNYDYGFSTEFDAKDWALLVSKSGEYCYNITTTYPH